MHVRETNKTIIRVQIILQIGGILLAHKCLQITFYYQLKQIGANNLNEFCKKKLRMGKVGWFSFCSFAQSIILNMSKGVIPKDCE
jgi:hypothetical protein